MKSNCKHNCKFLDSGLKIGPASVRLTDARCFEASMDASAGHRAGVLAAVRDYHRGKRKMVSRPSKGITPQRDSGQLHLYKNMPLFLAGSEE